ncbi:MAG: cell division ATP-binding protein FtsE [Muribaculaceae bacterium]|nr:ATP-binding cassette domain-containing protein [Bacteroidales bacterium]MDD6850937.1 ATP-binding cassette domain-containing protein [Bacteroidales bacterium]MDY2931953.1 ATP-binding cassette domain-containing protein [Muribaculaceae bacterium]MDY4881274.1 ATP-binding cassette domain-containing protein [Muribaculaceae bacterium]MDY5118586.1 ATP-binding cassette domain-containing protein [Muribaculaceae bacterium]
MAKVIEYRDVEILRQELTVLKNVNLSVEEGEFVYLIGKVGSGKSSLIKTMYAEIPIESGEAKVFDYDLAEIRRRDVPMLRRKIGVVFQDFQLLTDRSVADNLLFVLKATGWKDKEEMQERIDEVLKQVGMENKSYKMPHELSGGEQQRVVIARSILNKPKLILADEPTGNLDPETGHQIVLLLRGIAEKGTAVIMATHNINLVEEFPGRVIKCEDKKVVEPE